MSNIIYRVILAALKRHLVRKFKKRTPIERLKSRIYYKKHKSRIRFLRGRQHKKTGLFNKTRKLFKRTRPGWMAHKSLKHKHPVFKKIRKPPRPKTMRRPKTKFHVPKRK